MKKIFKVFLIINIIIIIFSVGYILYEGINVYINGINRNWLFEGSWLAGPENLVYGMEAIGVYFEELALMFMVCSILGIVPLINMPVLLLIIKRRKIYKKIKSIKVLIALIVVCIVLHIISFVVGISLIAMAIPYVEAILISCFILYLSMKKGLID